MQTFHYCRPLTTTDKAVLQRTTAPFSIKLENVSPDDGFIAKLMVGPDSVVHGIIVDVDHDLPSTYASALTDPNCQITSVRHTRTPALTPAVRWRIPWLRQLTVNLELYRNCDLFECLATSDISALHLLSMPTLAQQDGMIACLPRMRALVELGLYQEPPKLSAILAAVLPKLDELVIRNIRPWSVDLRNSPLTKLRLDTPLNLDSTASNVFANMLAASLSNSRVVDLTVYVNDPKIPHFATSVALMVRSTLTKLQLVACGDPAGNDQFAEVNGKLIAALISACCYPNSLIESLDFGEFDLDGSRLEFAIERLFNARECVLRYLRMRASRRCVVSLIDMLRTPRNPVHILCSVDLGDRDFDEFFTHELRGLRRRRNLEVLVAASVEDPARTIPLDLTRQICAIK